MIRTCLEFLLSRSIDNGTTSTGLLGWLTRRNASLDRFDTDVRQLDSLLRSTATVQRESLAVAPRAEEAVSRTGEVDATEIFTLPPQLEISPATDTKQSMRWFAALATAAALFLAVYLGTFRPSVPRTHAGEFSAQLTVVPGEVLHFINRAARSTQDRMEFSPLANLKMPTVPDWNYFSPQSQPTTDAESSPWGNDWQDGWQSLRARFVSIEETS